MNKTKLKATDGTHFNSTDCGIQRISSRQAGDIIAGRPQCTKPVYSWTNPKINQVCFTADKLGISAGENIPNQVWIRSGFFDIFPTLYYFNAQSVDKYCYIDQPELATCMEQFPSNPQFGDKFIKCDQSYWWDGDQWIVDYAAQKPWGGDYK